MKQGPHQNPMLKIIRGSAATVADTLRPGVEQMVVAVPSSGSPVAPWTAVRSILEILTQAIGPEQIGNALGSHRALASLALPAMAGALTVEEQATRSMHSALRLCSLPFPWLDSRALTDTIADVLAKALFGRRAAAILVADVFQIDPESMGVIRQ